MEPPDLPSECLAHIISYISDPVTLRSLLVANRTISDITHRNVESIMEGDVSFLCRFARLITVEKPILIYDKDDIERLARLPKLRSASFLLTPTYFQRASAQPAGRRAKIVEIQEQLNPFDNLSVLVSQILKNELMEIYCRDFGQAISIFLQTVGPIYVRTDNPAHHQLPKFSFEAIMGDMFIQTLIGNHQCSIHISSGTQTVDLKIDVDAMRNGREMKDVITLHVNSIPLNLNI